MNVLHAIHDFLPRHHAGSEIYTFNLCQALQKRCHITVLCADYDPSRAHATLTWRVYEGVPVIEVTNNWVGRTLPDTYRPPAIEARLGQVLDAVQPDVVHVHNLLNLSFELPSLARARRLPVVATLHDYTLVCASGGQRLHRADRHVCHTIDVDRCARCFGESVFYDQLVVGRMAAATGAGRPFQRLTRAASRWLPSDLVTRVSKTIGRTAGPGVTPSDMADRLDAASGVFETVDLFVAPSHSLAAEYRRLGLPASKLRVSDYGFPRLTSPRRHSPPPDRLRFGYVGSIVWHKGVHVLVEAVKTLPNTRWELKIFGDEHVAPDYVGSLKKAATGFPVRFLGGFERQDVARVFAEIDVLVVPSLWLENSPLVIHEAFMTGVPVVGARIGGIADLVEHGVNGLLYEPTSEIQLASALQEVIEEPSRVQALADRAPRVKSIDEDAAAWEAIYADLVGPTSA